MKNDSHRHGHLEAVVQIWLRRSLRTVLSDMGYEALRTCAGLDFSRGVPFLRNFSVTTKENIQISIRREPSELISSVASMDRG